MDAHGQRSVIAYRGWKYFITNDNSIRRKFRFEVKVMNFESERCAVVYVCSSSIWLSVVRIPINSRTKNNVFQFLAATIIFISTSQIFNVHTENLYNLLFY
jgi:hypothetical protein